jgi:hypothetical protein
MDQMTWTGPILKHTSCYFMLPSCYQQLNILIPWLPSRLRLCTLAKTATSKLFFSPSLPRNCIALHFRHNVTTCQRHRGGTYDHANDRGVVIQLETDPQSSTVPVYSLKLQFSPQPSTKLSRQLLILSSAAGKRTYTDVLFQPLHRVPLNLQFFIICDYCTSDPSRKLLLSISPFPARLLALAGPVRSLGVI